MKRRERTCRMCGTPNDLTRHHVIPQGHAAKRVIGAPRPQERTYILSSVIRDRRNIVMLCRRHHDAIDTYRILRGLLRTLLTEHETAFIDQAAGLHWLNKHYPRPEGHHGQG